VQSSSQIITTSKPTPSFLQAGCPSRHPIKSVRALKEHGTRYRVIHCMKRDERTYWLCSGKLRIRKHPWCMHGNVHHSYIHRQCMRKWQLSQTAPPNSHISQFAYSAHQRQHDDTLLNITFAQKTGPFTFTIAMIIRYQLQ